MSWVWVMGHPMGPWVMGLGGGCQKNFPPLPRTSGARSLWQPSTQGSLFNLLSYFSSWGSRGLAAEQLRCVASRSSADSQRPARSDFGEVLYILHILPPLNISKLVFKFPQA